MVWFCLTVNLTMVALETPPPDPSMVAIDFRLRNVDGKFITLTDVKKQSLNGLVVAFICNHCPYVRAIIDKIVRDANELKEHGVGFVAIMPNDYDSYPQDSFENMAIIAREKHFTFPYLLDDQQEIARKYGAVCTPDFFGFNANLKLAYRGRLDSSGMQIVPNARRELFDAMIRIARGDKPSEQHPSTGCSIKWRES